MQAFNCESLVGDSRDLVYDEDGQSKIMIWHLIKTGHRPKDGASVICLFYDGEAIECYYDREFDDFIPYDQELDMNPFDASDFKAWCFSPSTCSDLCLNCANADFLEFSKTHTFPPLKKKTHIRQCADDFSIITRELNPKEIRQCSRIILESSFFDLRRFSFEFECQRYFIDKNWNNPQDNNSVYAELSLTPKTLEWFNTNKSKSNYYKLILFHRIKFCDSEHNVISSFKVQFLRTIYKGRCCLPNNRPFKCIENDKFVVQFRLI